MLAPFPPLSMIRYIFLLITVLIGAPLYAQTIQEKISGIAPTRSELSPELQEILQKVNRELKWQRQELERLYSQVNELYKNNAEPAEYEALLEQINEVRERTAAIEEAWRKRASTALSNNDPYALWHQPETTLGDIIMDYGSQSYVYLMPPNISGLKLSLDSSLPIPRGAWEEMLDLILAQNGIGIVQLNPFVRQLYVLKEDLSPIALITNRRDDLKILPPTTRICFVLNPPPTEARRLWFFLDRFINAKTTVLQHIGRDILIIATVAEIQELLKLYDFAASNQGSRAHRLVPLRRADAEEMARIVSVIFDQLRHDPVAAPPSRDNRGGQAAAPPPPVSQQGGGLQIIPLKSIAPAVFVIGTEEEIEQVVKIIKDMESQIGGSKEKVIYTYYVRHSNAEDLAKILDRLYGIMVKAGARMAEEADFGPPGGPPGSRGPNGQQKGPNAQAQQDNRTVVQVAMPPPPPPPPPPLPADQVFGDSFYQRGNYVINPAPIEPLSPAAPRSRDPDRNNFIVDPMTNAIIMVVEIDTLARVKELLSKIDVPKQMVQIDVMFFEKRLHERTNFGLNLLRIGNNNECRGRFDPRTCNTSEIGATFNQLGIFDFFITRRETDSLPAFNALYSFLISQQDFQLNAAPSVLTLNQMPALISIQEEISLNMGEFLVDTATGQPALKNSYTRSQYGITVKVTPTVHMQQDYPYHRCPLPGEEPNYITLVSELTFDNIRRNTSADRPDVGRRQIQNVVRIPDGQSVILGGLREKRANDTHNAIPFLGELPGIGKLFSNTLLDDESTDMFIVITPRIVNDPVNDLESIKWEAMYRRPGDLPEFLCILREARDWEERQLLRGTMRMLFGRQPDGCIAETECCSVVEYTGEYDGRI